MRQISILPLLLLITQNVIGEEFRILVNPPNEETDEPILLNQKLEDLDMTRYLRDVIRLLKRDPQFFNMVEEEFEKDGYVDGWTANSLNKLKPSVKGILDELKRLELQRVLMYKTDLEKKGVPKEEVIEDVKRASRHLDVYSTDTFTPHDLRNLFGETIFHMEKDSVFRRNHFKYYEMHKQLELNELRKRISPEDLQQIQQNINDLHAYHKTLGPMHLPLSPDHLKEIWVDVDGMDKDQFNAKTFFHMHDIDGNKFWDENEVKILLERELQKMYNKKDADYDENEKFEEMERMIEYVEKEVDLDDNHLLEIHEVAEHLDRVDYIAFWESIWDKPMFSQEEFDRFSAKHSKEVNRMIDAGLITLPHNGVVKHLDRKAKLVR